MSLSLMLPSERCSIITIAEDGVAAPAWTRQLRWPGAGDEHVALPRGGDLRVWASRLDAAVMRAERPAVVLAEGIGCFAASWWARLSPSHYVSRVAGALLFDPAGEDAADRFASPPISLPFPTVVVGTGRDEALPAVVDAWGSRFIHGARERRDEPVAWEKARHLMLRLTRRVIERDIDQAYALRGLPPR